MGCIDREKESRNFIIETVKNIDRMQKDISVDQLSDCISCETSLITLAFNTIPVSFYMCNGSAFTATHISTEENHSNITRFRIESIRDDNYAVLRLINDFECLNQTCIIDLNCVCGLQCFQAINCVLCTE